MKLTLVIFITSCFCFTEAFSQNYYSDPPQRPKTAAQKKIKSGPSVSYLQMGAGVMGSVLYLSRNIKEKNDAYGYSFSSNYGGSNLLRVGVQYTYYTPINISPTWYNIHATTIEANLEIIARFKDDKTCLYPFVGLSYNTFSGYFTGMNDYLNLKEYYKVNSTAESRWLGANIGTGFEHAFGPVVLYLDYRMRIGKERGNTFNIMDVCYGGGLRVKIGTPQIKKIFQTPKERYKVEKDKKKLEKSTGTKTVS